MKINKKLLAGILAVSLCMTNLTSVYAASNHAARAIGINEELKNQLESDQYFVYQLNKIMEKSTYSMNTSLVDSDYIDNKTATGLQGIFSFIDLGKGYSGTYEEDYYKGVMAECITMGTELAGEENASEDLYNYINEELFDGLLENDGITDIIGDDTAKFIQSFMTAKDYVEGAYETGQLLEKMAYYSASHLNALELVEKNSDQNSSLCKAASYVTKAAKSKTYAESYYAWVNEYLGSASNITIEACISILTGGFSDLLAATSKALTGNKYENEMNELFYLNFQNAIRSAYNSIVKDKPNVMTAHYTYRELKDLADLTLLYLKCGVLGFEKNHWSNSSACRAAYRYVQGMKFPTLESYQKLAEGSVVTVSEYCIPTNLSKGDYYVVYGLLSSTEQIRKVTVEFKGAKGYLQCTEENINANQYDLHNMDSRLTINHLASGIYEYVVTVETVSGGRYEPIKETISIAEEDGNMTITGYRLPHPMSVGAIFNVVGTVHSPYVLREVRVEILDMNGNYMTGGRDSGAFAGYNLKNLDRYVEFNRLGRGEYWYVIAARNDVREEVLVKQKFVVR